VSAETEVAIDKRVAVESVVQGLDNAQEPASYDAVEVKQPGWIFRMGHLVASGHLFVREGSQGELEVVDETPETYALAVTTDAKEFHPVDGIPLIPGDGESYLTINLAKVGEQGKPLERKKDNDTFWLRTDHGTLRDAAGKNEIRSVKLTSGKASIRLYSEKAKRVATVHIFNADPYLRDTAVRVELT
jgi:hypothetical protein